MDATFLTHFATVICYPTIWQSWNSTLCILYLPFPLSLFQTLFSSLCSQTEWDYKRQKALPSLKSPFSMLFIPYNFLQSIF
jgi:hypothetical protein